MMLLLSSILIIMLGLYQVGWERRSAAAGGARAPRQLREARRSLLSLCGRPTSFNNLAASGRLSEGCLTDDIPILCENAPHCKIRQRDPPKSVSTPAFAFKSTLALQACSCAGRQLRRQSSCAGRVVVRRQAVAHAPELIIIQTQGCSQTLERCLILQ